MYNFEDLKIGVPYKKWGNDVMKECDCMGLTVHILNKRGIDAEMLKNREHNTFMKEANNGKWSPVDITSIKINQDTTVVIAFLNVNEKVDHVGVMANNYQFWHCPDAKGICLSDLTRPFWKKQRKVFYLYHG